MNRTKHYTPVVGTGWSFKISKQIILDDIYGGAGFEPFTSIIKEEESKKFKDLLETL